MCLLASFRSRLGPQSTALTQGVLGQRRSHRRPLSLLRLAAAQRRPAPPAAAAAAAVAEPDGEAAALGGAWEHAVQQAAAGEEHEAVVERRDVYGARPGPWVQAKLPAVAWLPSWVQVPVSKTHLQGKL